MKTIMEEFSEIKKQTDELAKMAGYTEEEIHQDIQRMKEGLDKDEHELRIKREVSSCCGANTEERNNDGTYCTECFDTCDIVEVDKNYEFN